MNNIFNFNYEENFLLNLDGSPSPFRGVYGQDGKLVVVPKGARYNVVQTEDVSALAHMFQDNGLKVTPFTFKSGEVIGITIPMGERASRVGDREVYMRLTIKNNGTGVGYLSAYVKRVICSNMAMRTEWGKEKIIKVPHTKDYNVYLQLAQQSVLTFQTLIDSIDEHDIIMNNKQIDKTQLMYHLNKWFFDYEFPDSQKGKMTFNEFRRYLYEEPQLIKPIDRHRELMAALDRELKHNQELGLKQSVYTAYAVVSNYLSRRIEKSGSSAPVEIVQERALSKLEYFNEVIPQTVLV